ncbi:1-acyl-sn-glycerol-3-phosphate acyltransferase [bacterium]|nr:1-acyl-sn-glycerol-3-phosphate acyltransferase [bacterium]
MFAQPRGGSRGDTADHSLLSFAAQHPLRYLWGLAADAWIAVSTIVIGMTAIAGTFITRRPWVIDTMGRLWSRGIVRACGIDLEVVGLERLQPGRSYILVSNHLSNFDIWCTLARMPFVVRFVAKKELLKIPVFGWALGMSGHIVIDRGDPQSAIARINAAAERTEQGIGLLFYAEGTRSRDGRVHEFKKGGVSLAVSTQLPVVPMSVSGTRKFLPRGCAVIRPGGRVRIVLGEPIPTTGLTYADRDALNERVRRVVVSNFVEELV